MIIPWRDSDISPYENYITAIRDTVTKKKYAGQLEMFLNPDYNWDKSQQKRKLLPEKEFAILVNNFVNLIRKDPNVGKNTIKRYVMVLKLQIDDKKLNPNTSRNRLKPIKTLLRANEVDFSWFLIDKMMPKETKSEDRAYTRAEIQKMIVQCEDITDKVIIIGFSAAGFRLEAWDYFTWSDVVFFRNEDGTYKGGALRIYHGDVEEYWTHITPEFCNLLDLYKVYWKSKFFAEPLSSGILLKDGLLTAREIFEKKIRLDSKILTLAVCDTGINETKPGDELIGFTRSFLYAGAQSIIVSLWKVNSKSTKIMMERFYEYVKKEDNVATALQKAQNDIRDMEEYSHPYYWAPFIVVGNSG